jgi:hypothetical protein
VLPVSDVPRRSCHRACVRASVARPRALKSTSGTRTL